MQAHSKPSTCTKIEEYDTEVMQHLINLSSSGGVLYVKGRRGNLQRVALADYLGPSLQNTGSATVEYELKSGDEVGRYCSGTGYQMFPSTIRSHLARRLYYDIDIQNAQPTLLLQLCAKLSMHTPLLRQYVEDREALLLRATSMSVPECTRDEAKHLFLIVLFGGSVHTWVSTLNGKQLNPDAPLRRFVEAFSEEVRRVASLAFDSEELSSYHTKISTKRNSSTNPKMRFLSIVVQTIECECLRVIDATLAGNNWSMHSLIFDGGLVRRQEGRELSQCELEVCELAVEEQIGYAIQLSIKPLEPSVELSELVARTPESDVQALDVLHRLAGKDWRAVNDLVYVYSNGVWEASESAFYGLMMSHREALGRKYGETLKHMRDVMQLARTRNRVDSAWTQQFDRLAPGLVPFANGIYDVATSTLRDFAHDDMITKKFDFDAPLAEEDVSAEVEQLRTMLERLLPDAALRLEVMTRLAESFFNCANTHKYFVQLYGEGNNGKTTLMRILQTAFPQWVQMPSVEHLVSHASAHNPNAPQPWLIDVMGARILGFEEPGEKRPFNGSLLKLLRGNGVVTGRALYKGNVSYIPTYTIWVAANDPIEIEPMDEAVLNSFHSFRMPSCFVGPESCAPLGKRFVFQKIPCLEQRFKERAYKLALLSVLSEYFEHYKRENSLPPLESEFSLARIYREEHLSFDELFDRSFVLDRTSKLSAADVFSRMQYNGYNESKKKLAILLEERFKKHEFVKLTKPNNVRTWVGLRAIDTGFSDN